MGTRLLSAFLAGAFFTFFLDFFFILGLFLNYIEAQGIEVYFNTLFADHQNIFLFLTGVVIFGYLFLFFYSTKIATIIFGVCFALVNLLQIPSIGFAAGEVMFVQENKIMTEGVYTYIGKTIYEGRDTIWFYDEELQKIITLKKENINVN